MNMSDKSIGLRQQALLAVALATALLIPIATTVSAQVVPLAGCLSWADDASGIVYCGETDAGSTELFEQDADGNVRQLTYLGGHIGSADVAVNGSKVAFHATLPNSPEPQIYVIDRHGPRLRKVMVGGTVIEIGKRYVPVGTSVVEIKGAWPKQLTDGGSNVDPVFSPDGDRIGFSSDRHGAVSLWSMSIDGSDQREMLVATAR